MADVTDVPGDPVDRARRVRPAGAPGRRAGSPPQTWRDVRDDQLRGRHRRCPADCPGCTMPRVRRWRSGRSRAGGPSGAHRALERRHLRPRGRRHRERRQHVALDVDRRRGRAQAGRRRRDRVRGRPPGARRARRRDRHARRPPGGPGRHPCRLPRSRPADERRRRSTAAARSAMARARELGLTSVAFPALGTGVGGFPARRGRAGRGPRRPRRAATPAVDRARDLRAARRGGLRGLRARAVRRRAVARQAAARPGAVAEQAVE